MGHKWNCYCIFLNTSDSPQMPFQTSLWFGATTWPKTTFIQCFSFFKFNYSLMVQLWIMKWEEDKKIYARTASKWKCFAFIVNILMVASKKSQTLQNIIREIGAFSPNWYKTFWSFMVTWYLQTKQIYEIELC